MRRMDECEQIIFIYYERENVNGITGRCMIKYILYEVCFK